MACRPPTAVEATEKFEKSGAGRAGDPDAGVAGTKLKEPARHETQAHPRKERGGRTIRPTIISQAFVWYRIGSLAAGIEKQLKIASSTE
jgi:hypothetical protein